MKNTKYLTGAALIAALYVTLTLVSAAFGLSGGAVQLRLSEALTVLPVMMPSAVPGLTAGCLIANIVTGAQVWDVVFGTLATLAGAAGTFLLRKKSRFLAPLPPILCNTLVIPPILQTVYGIRTGIVFLYLSVFAGELLSCGVLGLILLAGLKKYEKYLH